VARRCTAGVTPCASGWDTAVGSLEQVRVPRLRGWKEIGLLERYERHGFGRGAVRSDVGRAEPTQGGGTGLRRFLGGTLSPATIGAVLEQAQQQIGAAAQRADPGPGDIVPSWWMGIYCAIGGAFRRPHAKGCCW